MMALPRTSIRPACLAAALALVLWTPREAAAPVTNHLTVTVKDSIDPAASGGQVTYSIKVRNDGANASDSNAKNVLVTIPLPQGTQFLRCTTSNKMPCAESAGTVTTNLGTIKAFVEIGISLLLQMPSVDVKSVITVTAEANGDNAVADKNSQSTTLLPPTAPVVFLPSLRQGSVACGAELTPAWFQSDTTAQLADGLGCAQSPFGLKMAASGKTLDLNKFKIIGGAVASNLGNVGIVIGAGATDVTVLGASTNGTAGIEYFDRCVVDEGGNTGLTVSNLRCFRARSAGFDIVSDDVVLTHLLIDKVVGVTGATAELPGGIGIHASGKTHIKDTIVRRIGTLGIWADGSDPNGTDPVVTIDGNQLTSRIEHSSGIGIRLDGGPHFVKDTYVEGDGSVTSTDGIVAGAAGSTIDGVAVSKFHGNGIVVNSAGTRIFRTTVGSVGLAGFVSTASGVALGGNTATPGKDGFVISGPDNALDSNTAQRAGGNGFVVSGDGAILRNNNAMSNRGHGFVLNCGSGGFESNAAQRNRGDGFLIPRGGNTLSNNQSKQNSKVGFDVSGTGNHLNSNQAERNSGKEWGIAAGNFDDGGNRTNGHTFAFTASGGTFE